MLEMTKDTHIILVAVTNTHTTQTGEITGTAVTIEIQENTGITETTNKTGETREITEVNTMTTEATGPGKKTSP